MSQPLYTVRPAWFAPLGLTVAAAALVATTSPWYLVSIPVIWLSSLCARPNLNLVDGYWAYLAIAAGFVLVPVYGIVGYVVLFGAIGGLYGAAFEKWLYMKPVV